MEPVEPILINYRMLNYSTRIAHNDHFHILFASVSRKLSTTLDNSFPI